MKYEILQGDNRDTLKTLADNSIDAIITDPPYGIDFLGKSWDANTGALETYRECLRVLKPGGHILAFSAARTYHHLAITLEQAGFEIRDQIMWIYSSGFPKSQDIGRSIERSEGKKKKKVVADRYEGSNEVIEGSFGSGHGKCSKCKKDVVAARILGQRQACPEDGCEYNEMYKPAQNEWAGWGTALKPAHEPICMARKPIKLSIARNCQTHGVGALNIDATRVEFEDEADRKSAEGFKGLQGQKVFHNLNPENINKIKPDNQITQLPNEQGRFPSNVIGEIPDYQKYFYCPKVSRKERHAGFPEDSKVSNNHPTVKPIELMKYLIKLITPPGGTVLDPFNGSGSTGCAAVELGHPYIGCELDPAYVEISHKRIQAWVSQDLITVSGLFE